MKTINFRPLRRIKKTSKIAVASYMQWNKVRCGNYSEFILNVNNEYEGFDKSEFVYDHEGELLYHFNYNPWDVYEYHGSCIDPCFDWDHLRNTYGSFTLVGKDRDNKERRSYHWRGADCAGTPCFSHWNANMISSDRTIDMDMLEPLTVGNVIEWLGWFLYQLENSSLKVGK